MKKLLYILLTLSLFTACSSDDENSKAPNEQDYTSFVIYQTEDVLLTNCIAAYKKENKYYKLGDLGDLSKEKMSREIRVDNNSITEVYFFTDYNAVTRGELPFKLKKNKKNVFKLTSDLKGVPVYDKSDPSQYPQ